MEGRPDRVRTTLSAGTGAFDLGPGGGPAAAPRRLPFAGLAIAADITGRALALRQARLVLPGQGGMPGPALEATGEILHRDGGWDVALDLAASPLEASDLPRLWPAALAPEARSAALSALPAGLLRDTRLRGRFRLPDSLDAVVPEQASLDFGVSRAVVDLGRGRRIAADSADFALSGTPDHLRLERATLRLPAAGGPASLGQSAAGPTIQAEGSAERADGLWRGWLGVGLDAVSFAALPGYWPRGLGSPKGGERDWITQNITAGTIRNGRWRVEAEAPDGTPEELRITALTGTAEATDATVHWLRPIPPPPASPAPPSSA